MPGLTKLAPAANVGESDDETPVSFLSHRLSLLDRGFVSKFSREKDFFTPEHPAVLVKVLENGQLKLENSISKFKKHLSMEYWLQKME